MNYFRYKQFNKDVITVAVGFKNMLLFCIKFGIFLIAFIGLIIELIKLSKKITIPNFWPSKNG